MSVGNLLSLFVTSRSRLLLDQLLLGNSSRKRRELHFFSTRNAFITVYFELSNGTNIGGIGMYIANTFIHNEQVQYKIEPNDLVKTENI